MSEKEIIEKAAYKSAQENFNTTEIKTNPYYKGFIAGARMFKGNNNLEEIKNILIAKLNLVDFTEHSNYGVFDAVHDVFNELK